MIDISLSEQQELLLKTVEEFARNEIRGKIREIEEKGVKEIREKVLELGFFAIEFPESVGGTGMGMVERALTLKTLSQMGDGGATYSIFSPLPAIYAIHELTQQNQMVKEAIEGKKKITLAKCSLYPDDVRTRAKIGSEIKIVIEDKEAKNIIFFAKDDSKVNLCISDNFSIERGIFRSGLFSSPAVEVRINKFEVLTPHVLENKERWERFLARVKIFISAICAGICKGASDYALEYALERVAFGRPIAYHQAISFMLADMDTISDLLEIALLKTAWEFDSQKESYQNSATELMLEALEIGKKVTSDAVQILGGHGYIKDHPVEKWMRDFEDIIHAFGSPLNYEGSIKSLETKF